MILSTKRIVILLLVLGACFSTVRAQEGQLKSIEISRIENAPTENPQGKLTLRKALHLALKQNPQLAAFSLEIRAREAAALQASLWPNPELEIETENFAGSGPLQAFKASETTVSLGQLIELGGKRAKRTRLAQLGADLAAWDFEWQKLNVFAEVVIAFNEVLTAQKKVALNKEILNLAQNFKVHIDKRVQAGRLSPAELARATVEVAQARLTLQRSEKRLEASRQKLAALWGARQAVFSKAVGNLEPVTPLPQWETLQKSLNQNPNLLRFKTARKEQEVARALARAGRIPDPLIRAGWRRLNESGDQAFVAGVSLPLPLFNRNQGAEQEAVVRTAQIQLQEKAYRVSLESALFSFYRQLQAVFTSLQSLKNEIIPQARRAFEIIDAGYRQGKFGFLDVLEARRTLFSSREAYLRNLQEYHRLKAQIELLTAQALENVK